MGKKRWALLDPACGATAAEVRGVGEDEPILEAAVWFETVLPSLLLKYPAAVLDFEQVKNT